MRATREESLQPLKTFIYDNRVHKNINAVLKSGDPKGHYLNYIVDIYHRGRQPIISSNVKKKQGSPLTAATHGDSVTVTVSRDS